MTTKRLTPAQLKLLERLTKGSCGRLAFDWNVRTAKALVKRGYALAHGFTSPENSLEITPAGLKAWRTLNPDAPLSVVEITTTNAKLHYMPKPTAAAPSDGEGGRDE